jgi:hypothetical protein
VWRLLAPRAHPWRSPSARVGAGTPVAAQKGRHPFRAWGGIVVADVDGADRPVQGSGCRRDGVVDVQEAGDVGVSDDLAGGREPSGQAAGCVPGVRAEESAVSQGYPLRRLPYGGLEGADAGDAGVARLRSVEVSGVCSDAGASPRA